MPLQRAAKRASRSTPKRKEQPRAHANDQRLRAIVREITGGQAAGEKSSGEKEGLQIKQRHHAQISSDKKRRQKKHQKDDTLRGRPYILTFIFTRCPVPNFCPRISQNFSQLQDAIKSDPALATKARLLSITLDPKFDTPEVLRAYGEHQHADPGAWTFATGEPAQIDSLTQSFAVYVQLEAGTISHGLATALVGPDGSAVKI